MGKTLLACIVLQLVIGALSQYCLNSQGQIVDWWVILKVPPKIGSSGFGYMDSTSTGSVFTYMKMHADDPSTALYNTLNQINTFSLETVAWND